MSLENKFDNLKKFLKSLNSVAVAYSSGVDSTFLLKTAHDVLKENAIAITIKSSLFPQEELNEAIDFCKKENIKHIILDIDVFKVAGFIENPKDRCYICKKELFKNVILKANEFKISNILEGSNVDDLSDYRPGKKAIEELKIISPLKDIGLTKKEIRILSDKLDLKTAKKQSMACLASRIPYGEIISIEKLNMIDKAEKILKNIGFSCYRVRLHNNNLARIEINPDEFDKLLELRDKISNSFKEIGFKYVALDIQGYRTGAMNEVL